MIFGFVFNVDLCKNIVICILKNGFDCEFKFDILSKGIIFKYDCVCHVYYILWFAVCVCLSLHKNVYFVFTPGATREREGEEEEAPTLTITTNYGCDFKEGNEYDKGATPAPTPATDNCFEKGERERGKGFEFGATAPAVTTGIGFDNGFKNGYGSGVFEYGLEYGSVAHAPYGAFVQQ